MRPLTFLVCDDKGEAIPSRVLDKTAVTEVWR